MEFTSVYNQKTHHSVLTVDAKVDTGNDFFSNIVLKGVGYSRMSRLPLHGCTHLAKTRFVEKFLSTNCI